MIIRKAAENDAPVLRELYTKHLTVNLPEEEQDLNLWREKLKRFFEDGLYHILVAEEDGVLVSSVTLVIIENLTHNLRPYALIENVVTHSQRRNKGYASALMEKAGEIAKNHGCYKIMLLTGSKKESTLDFYRKRGFNSEDKTAFIKWLD